MNEFGANERKWREPDFKRSIEFQAVLLAMAGHDLRQHFKLFSALMAGSRGALLAVPNVSKSNAVSKPWRKWQSSCGN